MSAADIMPGDMENKAMENFTDDLLKEKIFNCQICDELCTSEIFLVLGKGNVCANCFEEKCGDEMKSRAELNTALILIMTKLILPCKFKSKGCDKRMAPKNYSKHVGTCDFKVKPCAMKNLDGCDWVGSNFESSGHLLESHQNHVIKGENGNFKVDTSLSEPFNVKILSDDYQPFLLKTSVTENKFFYSLNPIEKSEQNTEYSVEHKSTSTSNQLVIKTVGTLTKLNGVYDEQNLDKNPNATAVVIDLLKHVADENNMIRNEFKIDVKYPCKNKKLGCKEEATKVQLIKHEEICPFNTFQCPMNCSETGNFESILKHLESQHNKLKFVHQGYGPTSASEVLMWMLFDSRVFRISYFTILDGIFTGSSNTICWAVELVCSNENPGLFTYEVKCNDRYQSYTSCPCVCFEERSKRPFQQIKNGFRCLYNEFTQYSIEIKKKHNSINKKILHKNRITLCHIKVPITITYM